MNATKTQVLLEATREKLGGVTDYRLAKELSLSRPRISDYRHGRRNADAYACTRIAEVLGKDPLEIIAEVEAEAAKTQERRDYWANFRGIGRTATLGLTLSAILGFSGVGLPGGAEASTTSHNVRLRSSFQESGRKIRAWWTKNIGFSPVWYGCFGS